MNCFKCGNRWDGSGAKCPKCGYEWKAKNNSFLFSVKTAPINSEQAFLKRQMEEARIKDEQSRKAAQQTVQKNNTVSQAAQKPSKKTMTDYEELLKMFEDDKKASQTAEKTPVRNVEIEKINPPRVSKTVNNSTQTQKSQKNFGEKGSKGWIAIVVVIALFVFGMICNELGESDNSPDTSDTAGYYEGYDEESTDSSEYDEDITPEDTENLTENSPQIPEALVVPAIVNYSDSVDAIADEEYSVGKATIKKLKGNIATDGAYIDHKFTTSAPGVYTFEFADVEDGTDFTLEVYNSAMERIARSVGIDNGYGITKALEGETEYIVRVSQYHNYGSYTVLAGVQKPTVDVTDYSVINDSVQFTAQENIYKFTAPLDGVYRFEFSNVPDGTDLSLGLYNSGMERIQKSTDIDNGYGVTNTLVEGKTYYIVVFQYENYGKYTLNIGKAKPTVDISELTSVDDSVQFTSQENIYKFTAPLNGDYRFEFSNVPDGTDLSLGLYNSGMERIQKNTDIDNGYGITETLVGGKTYYIVVFQYENYGGYTLNIGKQKEMVAITGQDAFSDSVEFRNQENVYEFVPGRSGTYRFEFTQLSDDTDVIIGIYNSGMERLTRTDIYNADDGIEWDMESGSTYYIVIEQSGGIGSYRVDIEKQS